MINYSDGYGNGSRFTVIYAFCGITFVMLAATNIALVIGAWNLYARMTGLFCSCCLGCVNFAALITTSVFRFNSMGKLAALSLTPSQYKEMTDSTTGMTTYFDPNGRVYADDAKLITGIWIA